MPKHLVVDLNVGENSLFFIRVSVMTTHTEFMIAYLRMQYQHRVVLMW